MKKIKLLFAAMLSMMAWNGVMAQDEDPNPAGYDEALAAITDGSKYRISTEVSGTKYYVTTAGALTSTKAESGIFTITKTAGGAYKTTGFRIYGAGTFTNPPLSNNVANLNPGSFSVSTGNDRNDWERQVLFKNEAGKFAIRSCNTGHGTSSWADAGRTYWTYAINPVTPQYSYTPAYVWDFEEVLATVNVTYEVYDGETKVASSTVIQDANSEAIIPTALTGTAPYGSYEPYALYNYAVEEGSVIGDADCTIKVNRTFATGLVKALTDLSNNKAYIIRCDRGALLTKDGTIGSTSHSTLHDAAPANFAILSYEDFNYIYSVADKKFVLNNGSLAEMPSHGTFDAIQMTLQTAPYFLFTFKIDDDTTYGLNTNGTGALNGCVINSWVTPDPGDQYYMIEAADFDPTAALAELEAYFHPSYFVTYVVKDTEGNTIFTSEPQPTTLNAKITTLPADFQRSFYTYNEVDVTISETDTNVEFTATWEGPFEISASFNNAHWYDMAMRGTWYVTSAVKDAEDGDAYVTQNANTMGLVEDSYQWAFMGDGYNGFRIINKAEGESKSFGYTEAQKTNAGIPTVMDVFEGYHLWNIVPSTNTSVPAGSFCLNVPGTDLYINQYGGAGGKVKFWNNTANIGDAGSAFTIFDVPTNFASFVVDDGIAAAFEATGYFAFTDEAKANLGWDPAYTTDCPFEAYKSLKESLTTALADPENYSYPATGYYRIKSANYAGFYMTYTENGGNPVIGSEKDIDEAVANVVKLTALGDHKYTITVGGLSATAPGQSAKVGLAKSGAEFTAVVTAPGVGAFTTGETYGALHSANSQKYNNNDNGYYVVGWTADAAASQWIVEDATVNSIDATITAAGYATLNTLWPVTIPEGVKAYTGVIRNHWYNSCCHTCYP